MIDICAHAVISPVGRLPVQPIGDADAAVAGLLGLVEYGTCVGCRAVVARVGLRKGRGPHAARWLSAPVTVLPAASEVTS